MIGKNLTEVNEMQKSSVDVDEETTKFQAGQRIYCANLKRNMVVLGLSKFANGKIFYGLIDENLPAIILERLRVKDLVWIKEENLKAVKAESKIDVSVPVPVSASKNKNKNKKQKQKRREI